MLPALPLLRLRNLAHEVHAVYDAAYDSSVNQHSPEDTARTGYIEYARRQSHVTQHICVMHNTQCGFAPLAFKKLRTAKLQVTQVLLMTHKRVHQGYPHQAV